MKIQSELHFIAGGIHVESNLDVTKFDAQVNNHLNAQIKKLCCFHMQFATVQAEFSEII